jgi:atypical dual specificity phosphatase
MPEYEIYIGDSDDASDHARIENKEIDAILKLTYESPDNGHPDSVEVYEYSMTDGPSNDRERFKEAVKKLLELFEDGETIFVHCSAGKSRSPTVSAAAIAVHEDVSFESALETIRASRDVNPHAVLLSRGKKVTEELRQTGHRSTGNSCSN